MPCGNGDGGPKRVGKADHLGGAEAVPADFPVLRRWAGSSSPVLRVLAARSLPLAPFDPLPALEALALDVSDLVSAEAAHSLVRVGSEQARRTLTSCIENLAGSQPKPASRAAVTTVVTTACVVVFALVAELDIGAASAAVVALALSSQWVIRLLDATADDGGRLATARQALCRLEDQLEGHQGPPPVLDGAAEPVVPVDPFAFRSTDPRLTLSRQSRQLEALRAAEETGGIESESLVELLGSPYGEVVRRAAQLLAERSGEELIPVLHTAYESWRPVASARTRSHLPRWSPMLSLNSRTGWMGGWGLLWLAPPVQLWFQFHDRVPGVFALLFYGAIGWLVLRSVRVSLKRSREEALAALAILDAIDVITVRHALTSPVVIHKEIQAILADPLRVSGEARRKAQRLLAVSAANSIQGTLPVPGGAGQPALGQLPGGGAAGPSQVSGKPGVGQER